MDEAVDDKLLHQATLTLQQALGQGVVLSEPVVLKNGPRSLIARCQVDSADGPVSSVILKHIKADAVRGFSDWASLAFLSQLPAARNIVPRFYGGDSSHRLFLMEDMGKAESLQDILGGTDTAAAHAALQALAVQMARLHAASWEKQNEYEAIRSGLPERAGLGRECEARCWLDNREKFAQWFEALDCVPPSGWDECLKQIARIYRKPGGFLAFTHGDPAPSNNHFAQGEARLLDFEYGGFRHALYDITAWEILCPLPQSCVREMRTCFVEELALSCPAARDGAVFAEVWASLCAYRALAMMTWIPPDVIGGNRPWADNWTMREAVLAAVSRLEQVAAPVAGLTPVSDGAGILTRALRSRWPEYKGIEDLCPHWTAFQGGSTKA